MVAGPVFAPTRDRQRSAHGITRARGRDHYVVGSVRQQLGAGSWQIGGVVRAGYESSERANDAARQHLLSAWMRGRHTARDALLQQQLGCLHYRLAVKPILHC